MGVGGRKQPVYNKNYRLCHDISGVLPTRSQPAAATNAFQQRIANSSKRKGRPQKPPTNKKLASALEMALAREKQSLAELAQAQLQQTQAQQNIVYQDPETNTYYQVQTGAGGQTAAVEVEEEAAAEEEAEPENVIYQLPDGTITDRLGNPILDKDGNAQNIMNYQMAAAADTEATENMVFQMEGGGEGNDVVFEMDGLPSDMPILLDNGDGNYVAVGEDVLGQEVEKEGETITGDMYAAAADDQSTTYVDENGHPVTMEHFDGAEDPQAAYGDEAAAYTDETAGYTGETAAVESYTDETATYMDEATGVTYTEETAAAYAEETEAAVTQEEYNEQGEAIAEDVFAEPAPESEDMFENAGEDTFAEATSESKVMFEPEPAVDANVHFNDESEPAIAEDPYASEQAVDQYGSEIAADHYNSGIASEQFDSEAVAEQFGSETANTVISEGYETASTDYIAYEADKPEMSVEQALEEMMGEESEVNDDKNNVLDELLTEEVPNGTSSLLKNALQQSGIVSTDEHVSNSLKGALTYQISHVDGKQQVRITGVAEDVKSPSKDIPFAVGLLPLQDALQKLQAMPDFQPRKTRSSDDNKRKNSGGSEGAGPEKRILLTEDWKIVEEESATKNAEEMSND